MSDQPQQPQRRPKAAQTPPEPGQPGNPADPAGDPRPTPVQPDQPRVSHPPAGQRIKKDPDGSGRDVYPSDRPDLYGGASAATPKPPVTEKE